MGLFVVGINKINLILVERDRENMPGDLLRVGSRQFTKYIEEQGDRLETHFQPSEVEEIETEFREFRKLPYREVRTVELLQSANDKPFEEAWNILGERFQLLRKFVGALASIFPNTASVESDFSLINHEKNDRRTSLTNLSLEGVLQCKQFHELSNWNVE